VGGALLGTHRAEHLDARLDSPLVALAPRLVHPLHRGRLAEPFLEQFGDAAGFAFDLALDATQPVLVQGDAGTSRKGPRRGTIANKKKAASKT